MKNNHSIIEMKTGKLDQAQGNLKMLKGRTEAADNTHHFNFNNVLEKRSGKADGDFPPEEKDVTLWYSESMVSQGPQFTVDQIDKDSDNSQDHAFKDDI